MSTSTSPLHVMLKVVIGLGNEVPLSLKSSDYAGTRHNVGADFITYLSTSLQLPFQRYQGFKGYRSQDCFFVVLGHYMNHSGTGVQQVLAQLPCLPHELLIIHDEIELAYGQMKFKLTGGHKGHNGLRHIMQCLGTNNFCRLSIGVDRVESVGLSDYVLGHHDEAQQAQVSQCFAHLCLHLEQVLVGTFQEVAL